MTGGRSRGHVVVVGDVMTDIIVRPAEPSAPGSDRRATIREHRSGGARRVTSAKPIGARRSSPIVSNT